MEIGNRDRTVIVSMLAGLGHRLRHLLRAAGLAKSTYYHLLSHPAAVTRPDIEPMVAEIFARTPNGCGHRQIRMCLVHEFGVRVSHKSVLKVMRRMGLECRIVLLQCLFDRFGSVFPQCGLMVFPGVVIVSR